MTDTPYTPEDLPEAEAAEVKHPTPEEAEEALETDTLGIE